ncbi:hypothetical protein NJB1907E90_41420 [Mycobacterium marinum]|nr:hypothetical protein NJB1907E90_41420 [Mycobacterium marinum]
MFCAAAQTRLAKPNTVSPIRYDMRAPTFSSIALTVVAETTEPTRYRVVTQGSGVVDLQACDLR